MLDLIKMLNENEMTGRLTLLTKQDLIPFLSIKTTSVSCQYLASRRKSPACPKFDMIWLYLSPIPVGRRGAICSFKWFLPAFATLEEGVRWSAPHLRWKNTDEGNYVQQYSINVENKVLIQNILFFLLCTGTAIKNMTNISLSSYFCSLRIVDMRQKLSGCPHTLLTFFMVYVWLFEDTFRG